MRITQRRAGGLDEQGAVVEDREVLSWGFQASLPDGRYLMVEEDEPGEFALRVYDQRGESVDLYDKGETH